jgi:S-DNA-T family DNA segregation ATPase FtsK/SpoIIIE
MAHKENDKKDKKERKEKKYGNNAEKRLFGEIKTETMQAVLAIICFVVALLAILAALGQGGAAGYWAYGMLDMLLGIGYYLVPLLFVMLGISFLQSLEKRFELSKIIGSLLFFISALGLVGLLPGERGGKLGHVIAAPLLRFFEVYASTALLIAGVAISILILFEAHFTLEQLKFWKFFAKDKKNLADSAKDSANSIKKLDEAVENATLAMTMSNSIAEKNDKEKKNTEIKAVKESKKDINEENIDDQNDRAYVWGAASMKPFTPPPLSLLETDRGRPETGDIKANANIIKRTLQNFGINVEMDEISIGPSVTRYALKPAEGVKLSRIVSLNNDLALALAAHPIRIEAPIPGKSLVGIEIPNSTKTTVGLATLLAAPEFQQSDKPLIVSLGKGVTGKSYFTNLGKAPHMLIAGATGSGKSVTIHAIITSLLFRNSPENLKFIMIDPKRVELTLYNSIPHLLTPVITDPKRAILALKWAGKEMSRRYDVLEKSKVRDIDSYHKTVAAFMAKAAEKAGKNGGKGKEKDAGIKSDDIPESMPYIAIVLDELADIMQMYPRELESAIVRLAQMSRAVGIHLIISTQRPSVNVITGLIKANIPTRVALQVSSQIDSRTILDMPGAEKLLGSGDMLYLGGEMSKPVRLQSAFISETEVKKVVRYLANEYKDEIMGEINITTGGASGSGTSGGGHSAGSASEGDGEPARDAIFSADVESSGIGDSLGGDADFEDDEMYEGAREAVVSAGKASTSYIQRKLGIGYSRAAKLMDMLEERGVIGPANGSKPREVFGAHGTTDHQADTAVEHVEKADSAAKSETSDAVDTDTNI